MAFKFFAFAALLTVASAGVISSPYATYASAPVVAKVATPLVKQVVQEEYDPHPQYSYGYDVEDHLTGDVKSQKEERDGDVVHGSYSLIDADGMKRTVEYTADPIHGFNAVVHREPIHGAKVVGPAPVAYAAPVTKYAATPVAYAAPIAKYAAAPVAYAKYATPVAYAAPVAKYAASPVAYAAPVAKYAAAPVAYASPLAYASPVAKTVSYAAPTYSAYHH